MKVLSCLKRVVDPYAVVRVRDDNSAVETKNVKMATNPFCENALEQALRWKDEQAASEVVAMTIGAEDAEENLRAALALGADRALRVHSETQLRPLQAASVIAEVARREKVDVVWLGKQSIDGDNNQTGQMAAALLGWPQALFLSKAVVSDGKVLAESEVDEGIACLEVDIPCVLTADLRLNEPRYPPLPAIIKAKAKPIEVVQADELGPLPEDRMETIEVVPPPKRQKGRMIDDVTELATLLRRDIKALS